MFHQLVNHNDDIRRLVEKGYAIAFDGNNYLLIRDIPYLDHKRQLQIGAMVTKFVDIGNDRIVQDNHEIFFAGSHPHSLDGSPITNLGGGTTNLALSESSKDVIVERSFSNKPVKTGQFANFFDKIESYVNIICGPAIELHGATPLTFRIVDNAKSGTPFKVRDTLTSRAEIGDLALKFKDDVIAIIGVGGTGAYILDFLVKTPVKEILAFDQDFYYVHNTFRSPGKLELDEIGKSKAEVYQARYANFRNGLSIKQKFIDASSSEDLNGVTFAFVCVDNGPSRVGIFDLLIALGIPFIDVGLGLDRNRGPINGMLRTTYYAADNAQAIRDMGLAELSEHENEIYRTNIQIGELNALNACMAVIRFKQLRGFYFQQIPYYHLLLTLGELKIVGNAEIEPD